MALSLSLKNKCGDVVADSVDSGSTKSSGYIEIRDGVRPSTVEDTATGKVLVTITLSNPAFTDFLNGTAAANPTSPTAISETGTATWFRLYDRDDNGILDGDISDSNGNGHLILDNTSLVVGGSISITSLQLIFG